MPVFSGRVNSNVVVSPDGNLVCTIQNLPSEWEGDSPFEGQTTSRLVNVFNIQEERVIVPPLSGVPAIDEFDSGTLTAMSLGAKGEWLSVFQPASSSTDRIFSFRIDTDGTVLSPHFTASWSRPLVEGGGFFIMSQESGGGVWNQDRGFITNDGSSAGVLIMPGATSSPDGRWIASANSARSEALGSGTMILWDLDLNVITEFGPKLVFYDEETEVYHDDSFGNPNFVFSGDSRYLFFETAHPGFVENDNNWATDLFRYAIETGEILLISARNPDLPLPNDGFTVSAPVVENAVTRIFHKHRIDPDAAWIEAATTETDDGRVKFKDVGSTIHRHKFYKSEVTPVEGGQ